MGGIKNLTTQHPQLQSFEAVSTARLSPTPGPYPEIFKGGGGDKFVESSEAGGLGGTAPQMLNSKGISIFAGLFVHSLPMLHMKFYAYNVAEYEYQQSVLYDY